MAFQHADPTLSIEDDFDLVESLQRRPPSARRRAQMRVDFLAWVVLVLLSFGPVIGYALATWFD